MTEGDRRRRDPGELELSPAFWARFAREHWEQAPLLLERPFPAPLLGRDELFEARVRASEQYAADGRQVGLPRSARAASGSTSVTRRS